MKLMHLTVPSPANAGDLLLSDSVRKLFNYEWGNQDWIVKSLRQLTTQETIEEANSCDALILGGGGLFLKDTNKNKNSGWQWNCPVDLVKKISIPFALFGVGYNRFRGQGDFEPIFKKHINAVAEKCVFMGLRNNGSIQSTLKYLSNNQNKLHFQPCSTTLSKEIYGITEENAWSKGGRTLGFTVAFDRKKLRFGQNENYALNAIANVMEWAIKNDWDVKIINQHDSDMKHHWLASQSKKYSVINTCFKSPKEVVSIYNDIALLVGMRGHSQLIPFGVNNAFLSIVSHDKLQFFLDDINHPEWGVEVKDKQLKSKLISKIKYMDNNRDTIQRQINESKKYYWDITRSNLKYLQQNFESN